MTLTGNVDLKPTLQRISSGSSYPHRNDGSEYKNYPDRASGARLLPRQPSGYYTEYVVPTSGVSGPSVQRVIVGRGGEVYYSPDHYKSVIRLDN